MKPNLPPKPKSQETETRCNWTGPWQWDQQKILKIPFCWESDIPSNNNDNKEEVSLISGFFIIFALLVLPLKCRHAHFLSLSHIVFSAFAFFSAPIFQTTTFYAVSTQQAISVLCQWCMHYPYIMLENASATTNTVWKTKDLLWFRLCLCASSYFWSPFCKHVCSRVTAKFSKSLYLLEIG